MPPLLLRDYRYEKHIHDLAMSIWWQVCFQLPVCSVQRGTCQDNRSSLVADLHEAYYLVRLAMYHLCRSRDKVVTRA